MPRPYKAIDYEKLVYAWNSSKTITDAVSYLPGHSENTLRATVCRLRKLGVKLKKYQGTRSSEMSIVRLNRIAQKALKESNQK